MKILQLFMVLGLLMGLSSWENPESGCRNSQYILDQVKKRYDKNDQWQQLEFAFHIQEPRVQNPQRYSKIKMNLATNHFEMERTRPEGVVKRMLDGKGNSKITVNDQEDIDTGLIKKYGLNAKGTQRYQGFYKTMYGFPMTLTPDFYKELENAKQISFEGKDVYEISMELKGAMISKHWAILVDLASYEVLALQFRHPLDPEHEIEQIRFEGEVEIAGVRIPRMRHWTIVGTNEYLGSDIIVKELK